MKPERRELVERERALHSELFARKLIFLRTQAHLDGAEIARLLGVTRATYATWENAQRVPSLMHIYKLFKYPQFRGYLESFFDEDNEYGLVNPS
ncbi:helix-turn-helix transcriptional regulator [Succinimonas amylolytica]|uniref:helix-turn-helix transcriptional regulator n=1 Tax=Succinimonas amylolytica TaxID=83769 RepID=UPI00036BF9D6|nr:helix-turn-helix transcriptional regulator [Succinimonas amylolytica]